MRPLLGIPRLCYTSAHVESAAAVIIALRDPSGFGKTMLAQAICHDDRMVSFFERGILWATLGEQPRVLEKLSMLFMALTDGQWTFTDQDAARVELVDRLRSKRCLIVSRGSPPTQTGR